MSVWQLRSRTLWLAKGLGSLPSPSRSLTIGHRGSPTSQMAEEAMEIGDEREEVGGVIHSPIFDTKHMFRIIFAHSCFLAI